MVLGGGAVRAAISPRIRIIAGLTNTDLRPLDGYLPRRIMRRGARPVAFPARPGPKKG